MSNTLEIRRGDDWECYLAWPDESPIDLSTYSADWQLRDNVDSAETLVDADSGSSQLTLGTWTVEGGSYNIRLALTAAETAALPRLRAVTEVKLTDPDGKVMSITGTLPVNIVESVVR